MADIISSIVNSIRGVDAYSRKDRVPIKFQREMTKGGAAEGAFDPSADSIDLTIPTNSAYNPADVSDILKHELVHHILNGVALPNQDQYNQGFKLNLQQKAAPSSFDFSSPQNLWNWGKNARAGDPQIELPAYMSIYRQDQLPYVNQQTRDTYMQDLFNYFNSQKRPDLVKKITDLVVSRNSRPY